MILKTILFLMPFTMSVFPLATTPGTTILQENLEYRASFDLGSGTVKIQAAMVDAAQNKIAKVLYAEGVTALVRESIDRDPQGNIPPEMVEQLKNAMLQMRKTAELHGQLTHVVAGATEAYRVAKNGPQVIQQLSQETGIPIYLLSQEEEARLGIASLASEGYLKEGQNALVWENGSGSTQMTAIVDGQSMPYNLQVGKTAMKNTLIQTIQGKDFSSTNTPNPVSLDEAFQGIEWAKTQFISAPSGLKQEKVLGIGAMFPNVKKALGKSVFTKEELMGLIETRLGQTDEEMGKGDPNAPYMLSDLLFLYGAMDALGIESVEMPTLSGPGNTSGLLTDLSQNR